MSTSFFQKVLSIVARYLKIGVQWIGQQCLWILSTLFRVLKIAEILHFLKMAVISILKWCGITILVVVGGMVVLKLARWGLQKFLEARRRRINELHQRQLRGSYLAWEAREQAARAQRARERQALLTAEQRRAAAKRVADQQAADKKAAQAKATYMRWEAEFKEAFRDKPSMTRFPFPQLPRCTEDGCSGYKDAGVCRHVLEPLLRGSGKYSLKLLKEHIYHWHEDRFTHCKPHLLSDFRKLARSLFVIICPLYEELEAKEKSYRGNDAAESGSGFKRSSTGI